MPNSENFFKPSREVGDKKSSQELIRELTRGYKSNGDSSLNPPQLVWKGSSNAKYKLHSTLYRYLLSRTNGNSPPDEHAMLVAEKTILEAARSQWRFDNLNALEMFAKIQSYGGPTRLLEVSYSPLIALWFAVAESFDSESGPVDGMLFAFKLDNDPIQLDEVWGGYNIPWDNNEWWGEDSLILPSIWRPPSYNEGIAAQNLAFLTGPVPANPDHRLETSFDLGGPLGSPMTNSVLYSTIKILADAKQHIRQELEKLGYTAASLCPDIYGLAKYVKPTD